MRAATCRWAPPLRHWAERRQPRQLVLDAEEVQGQAQAEC